MKYFGSKEKLFTEAVSFEAEARALLDCGLASLGEHLVRVLLELHDKSMSDPFLRAVLAAFRPNGTEFSASFQRYFVAPLVGRLPGPDAALRAELICAQLVGIGAVRLALRLPALSAQSTEDIVARMGPVLQALIDGA